MWREREEGGERERSRKEKNDIVGDGRREEGVGRRGKAEKDSGVIRD